MKVNFKREVKRNKNKYKIRQETRENEPLLSWVVDPPGTKGGPRAGNFPGPPINTFCPGWSHDPGQKATLLSQVKPRPGTKGPFIPGGATTRDKRVFCPGLWLHPGQKGGAFCPGSWLHPGQKMFLGGPGKFPARGPPLVPGGSTTRDKRGPFSLISAKSYFCFCFFTSLLK